MMDSVRVTTSVYSPALAVSFTSTGRASWPISREKSCRPRACEARSSVGPPETFTSPFSSTFTPAPESRACVPFTSATGSRTTSPDVTSSGSLGSA
ncbi:hypothetical protein [Corallococcus sp. 4LFB]|uniref:hypothetical protein n=1 Tax=Corallococcus sp. 4LFB TaxID=3383249 RepID=UPI00397521E8